MPGIEVPARLVFEDRGSGMPVAFLHGLTNDRTCWRPIIDRLGEDFHSLAIDLPGHGGSVGPSAPPTEVAAMIHDLLDDLGIERPLLVGHSMSGWISLIYAASYPTLGVVNVDWGVDTGPFVTFLQEIRPGLEGEDFGAGFEVIQSRMGLEMVPEPVRAAVLAGQTIDRDLVLGYLSGWLDGDPERLQAGVEERLSQLTVPYLALYGRTLGPDERRYMEERIADLRIEEYPGAGHFVHLADADRFVARLRLFIGDLQC